jgi:hypothetical protein
MTLQATAGCSWEAHCEFILSFSLCSFYALSSHSSFPFKYSVLTSRLSSPSRQVTASSYHFTSIFSRTWTETRAKLFKRFKWAYNDSIEVVLQSDPGVVQSVRSRRWIFFFYLVGFESESGECRDGDPDGEERLEVKERFILTQTVLEGVL